MLFIYRKSMINDMYILRPVIEIQCLQPDPGGQSVVS